MIFLVDALVLALHRSFFDENMFQVLLDTNWQKAVEFVDNYSTPVSAKIFWILPLAVIDAFREIREFLKVPEYNTAWLSLP
ncbi:MAG: hypothetical protein IKO05_01370 [Selenomonadaceae bacterium]|nr:hypothetical protein [Selenomonadaceae bacterium]